MYKFTLYNVVHVIIVRRFRSGLLISRRGKKTRNKPFPCQLCMYIYARISRSKSINVFNWISSTPPPTRSQMLVPLRWVTSGKRCIMSNTTVMWTCSKCKGYFVWQWLYLGEPYNFSDAINDIRPGLVHYTTSCINLINYVIWLDIEHVERKVVSERIKSRMRLNSSHTYRIAIRQSRMSSNMAQSQGTTNRINI